MALGGVAKDLQPYLIYYKVTVEENRLVSQLAKPGTWICLCIMRVQAAGLGAFKESIKQVDFFFLKRGRS